MGWGGGHPVPLNNPWVSLAKPASIAFMMEVCSSLSNDKVQLNWCSYAVGDLDGMPLGTNPAQLVLLLLRFSSAYCTWLNVTFGG